MAALLTVLGPLAAAGLILLVRRAASALALAGVFVSLAGTTGAVLAVHGSQGYATTLPGLPSMPLRLIVDPLASALALAVAIVATLVMIYAVGYMQGDSGRVRFFAAMSFFVAAMQALVIAADWILFVAAWELVGLASYLLIGFWYRREDVPPAATRAFLTTRAADVGLYVAVFILIDRAGTSEITGTMEAEGGPVILAGFLLLLAAMAKSAQVPLQGWLQDAMAGPTPVSALLHSATLVVAGVVLLVRVLPLLTDDLRLLVGLVGGITIVLTGTMATVQQDFKRMLASSTSSQLGYMLLAVGTGSAAAAVFHLVTNAAVKSALFLGAGIFQRDRGSTSFAELAGVGRYHRRTFLAVALAGLSLAGIPPLAAFWSKDAVIAAALRSSFAPLFLPLALLGAFLTGAYTARALRILWGTSEQPAGKTRFPRRFAALFMGTGLAGLALLAALLGSISRPLSALLDLDLYESVAGLLGGLVAALLGLVGGWTRVDVRLPRALQLAGRTGFRIKGGYAELVAHPSLRVALFLDRQDRAIHSGVLGAGRWAAVAALRCNRLDALVHGGVLQVGTTGLRLASASRVTDEAGIDALIQWWAGSVRQLGTRARQLQTGLVHRELLVAAGATVLLAILLFT